MTNENMIPKNFYFHGNEIEKFIHIQVPIALNTDKMFKGIIYVKIQRAMDMKITPSSASSLCRSFSRGYIIHSHLSWRDKSSPSLPTTSPSHFLIRFCFFYQKNKSAGKCPPSYTIALYCPPFAVRLL